MGSVNKPTNPRAQQRSSCGSEKCIAWGIEKRAGEDSGEEYYGAKLEGSRIPSWQSMWDIQSQEYVPVWLFSVGRREVIRAVSISSLWTPIGVFL